MKQAITIEVDVNSLHDGVLVYLGGSFKVIEKDKFQEEIINELNELKKENQILKQQISSFVSEQNNKIDKIVLSNEKIKKSLIAYGFESFKEEN